MKLLLIILTIYTNVYGNNNSSYSNNHHSYSSVPVEQTYRGIGYSTNYSNGQFNSSQYFTGNYQPSSSTINNCDNYSMYGLDNSYNSSPIKAPPGERILYSGYVTVDGATVYWEITGTDIFGIGGNYKIYVDGVLVDSGWMWNSEVQRRAKEEAQKVAEEKAHSVPIDDATVPLLSLLLLYVGYDVLIRPRLKK